MMNLATFVGKITATLSRNELQDELDELDKLSRMLLNSFEGMCKQIPNQTFSSKMATSMEELLVKEAKVKKAKNYLFQFVSILKTIQSQVPTLQSLVDKEFQEDISTYALNIKRVNVLKYIPVMTFAVGYMQLFTSYTCSLEVNLREASDEPVFDLLPWDGDYLLKHNDAFLKSVATIVSRGDKLQQVFDKLPDISVSPDNAKMVQTTQGSSIDPMSLGIIPLPINPFYLIGMVRNNYQVNRYHAMTNELKALELKAYNLKLLNEGKNNAKTQNEIRYLEDNRIRPIREELAKMEEKYNA